MCVLRSADAQSSSEKFQVPKTMGRLDFCHRKQVLQSLYWVLIPFEDPPHPPKLVHFVQIFKMLTPCSWYFLAFDGVSSVRLALVL